MNKQTKSIIIGGLSAGIVYAILMVGFDRYDSIEFRIWRFILNAIFFGTFMSLVFYFDIKRKSKKKNNND